MGSIETDLAIIEQYQIRTSQDINITGQHNENNLCRLHEEFSSKHSVHYLVQQAYDVDCRTITKIYINNNKDENISPHLNNLNHFYNIMFFLQKTIYLESDIIIIVK